MTDPVATPIGTARARRDLAALADLARLERAPAKGFVALVGTFDDAPDLPDILDRMVRDRRS